MKKLFFIFLIAISSNIYGATTNHPMIWRPSVEIFKEASVEIDPNSDDLDLKMKKYQSNKEIGITSGEVRGATYLSSIDCNNLNMIKIRLMGNRIDIAISLGQKVNRSTVYLLLLDKDRLLIESLQIDSIASGFNGTLYFHKALKFPSLLQYCSIKYFELEFRNIGA